MPDPGEDEAVVRRLVLEILEQRGYSVLEASGPEEALALAGARGNEVDLVLTDVVMPAMNGRELAERLAPLCPRAGVLYMSGHTEEAGVRRGALDPGRSFIQKPFTVEGLARAVREALDARVAELSLPVGATGN